MKKPGPGTTTLPIRSILLFTAPRFLWRLEHRILDIRDVTLLKASAIWLIDDFDAFSTSEELRSLDIFIDKLKTSSHKRPLWHRITRGGASIGKFHDPINKHRLPQHSTCGIIQWASHVCTRVRGDKHKAHMVHFIFLFMLLQWINSLLYFFCLFDLLHALTLYSYSFLSP